MNQYALNRKRIRAELGSDAPIVLTAHSLMQRSADVTYPFHQDSNFWYLTGINEPGIVLVLDKDKEFLIVPSRDAVRTAFEGEIETDKLVKISGIDTVYDQKEGWEKVSKILSKAKQVATLQPSPAYIESVDMFTNPSRSRFLKRLKEINDDVEILDLRPHFTNLRMIKQEHELKAIEQAIAQTIKLYGVIDKNLESAENENELLAEIQKQLIRDGLDFAYDPVIAGGKNAVTLHYTQNNSKLEKNEFLLLDIGVKYNGYCADLTRTVVRSPTQRQQAVYDAVKSVHAYACSKLKPGVDPKAYEEEVLQFMGEKLRELGLIKSTSKETVREFYPHSTSHFLGIDVHDAGDYSRTLEPGMVLTVEPGIYIKDENIGIRLEDNIVITKDGSRNLSADLPMNSRSLTIKNR